MDKMLQFNPYFRIGVDEALSHPFFTKVRKPYKERLSDTPIELGFEKDHLDRDRLRVLFLETILDFKQKKQEAAGQMQE